MQVDELDTEAITLNIGPQHPSTHGVFRMKVQLQGETLVDVEPILGYLHRCQEKLAERHSYLQSIPYTDRLDYVCSMTNNHAYVLAVEKLAGLEVPRRAECIRVIMDELTRVMNHSLAVGFLLNDMGAWLTPVQYALREREKILDLFEMASGSRMMCNYMRFGGVVRDLPAHFVTYLRKLVAEYPAFVDEYERLLTTNEVLMSRCKYVGILPPDDAIAYGVTGPVLRASGVPYDVRKVDRYSLYDELDFEVPVGTIGDTYDRYLVRVYEMRQSLRILEQIIPMLEETEPGDVQSKVPRTLRPPAGDAYGRIEGPKGELGFYLVSDGSDTPYRWRVRAPSFINLMPLAEMCRGHKVADAVVILGSIDITMAEVDR
ncbi:MAG: NADH-quinone oxidoreductase subunit D [Chloroflexia bacterium]|nr:NADH-quinone oxidoreductase subunit D [Chloroflexia bacterium]